MKYYIDCGSYDGTTVKFFREMYDKECEYHIYSFEPLPEFKDCLKGIKKNEFFNKAVWIKDGIVDFYLSRVALRDGSTILKEKKTGNLDYKNPIKVECIDFSAWIKKTFNKDDYIILKIKIDGYEYKVLGKMIEDGTIDYINKLYVDWHHGRIGLSEKEHINLVNKIKIPLEGVRRLPALQKFLTQIYE